MINQHQFTEVIEHLRTQKKLAYQTFLDGIISERSYRRYVNEEKSFTFKILILLVERLQMKMRDFIIFALNYISMKHQQEIYLYHYLDYGMDEAAKPYLDQVKPPFYTHVGSKVLPSLLKRHAYKNRHIDFYDYLHFLKSQITLDTLAHRKIIDRNSVKVLILILEDGTYDDQIQVIPILFDIMLGNKQLISHQFNVDINNLIQSLAHMLFSTPALRNTFSSVIDQTFHYALNNVKEFHLEDGFISFFTDALKYIHKEHALFSNYVLYYLMIQRFQNHEYHYDKDLFLLELLSKNEVKSIIMNTSYSDLYFMKEGNHSCNPS